MGKKVQIYSELIEALYEMENYVEEYQNDMFGYSELSDEEDKNLKAKFDNGKCNAMKIAENFSFVLSPDVLETVYEMLSELGGIERDIKSSYDEQHNQGVTGGLPDAVFEGVQDRVVVINKCLKKIKNIAIKDLEINSPHILHRILCYIKTKVNL